MLNSLSFAPTGEVPEWNEVFAWAAPCSCKRGMSDILSVKAPAAGQVSRAQPEDKRFRGALLNAVKINISERCQSGLMGSPGKRRGGNATRVQIPVLPP